MIMAQWLTDGTTKIGWDMFPDRKKPAICITKCGTNVIDVYGYFKDIKTAHAFMDCLGEMVHAQPAEE